MEMVDALAHALLDRVKVLARGVTIIVYEYYNALAIDFAPDDKPSHAVLSLAVMPRWVTLCFLFGKGISDPPFNLIRGRRRS